MAYRKDDLEKEMMLLTEEISEKQNLRIWRFKPDVPKKARNGSGIHFEISEIVIIFLLETHIEGGTVKFRF